MILPLTWQEVHDGCTFVADDGNAYKVLRDRQIGTFTLVKQCHYYESGVQPNGNPWGRNFLTWEPVVESKSWAEMSGYISLLTNKLLVAG